MWFSIRRDAKSLPCPPIPHVIPTKKFGLPFKAWVLFYLSTAILLIALGFTHPDQTPGTKDPGWLDLTDWALFQMLQVAFLGISTGLALWLSFDDHKDFRAFWGLTATVCFLLFWRELDIDQIAFGERAFSWSYLLKEKVPLWQKLLFGVPSLGLALFWAIFLPFKARTIFNKLRLFWRDSYLKFVAISGFAALFISQIFDKRMQIYRYWGLEVYPLHIKEPYPEEALELFGELAVLICVIRMLYLRRAMQDDPSRDTKTLSLTKAST